MSKIQFSGFKTPYDEEQAFQRHMTYLKTKQKTSIDIQRQQLNNELGINQVMPMPKTSSEMLENEQEVNRLVQQYLVGFFVDNPNLEKKFSETDSQYENRKYPSRYVFNNLSQDDKKILLEQYPAIKTELKDVAILTPSYFLNFIKNYKEAIQRSGGVSKFSNNNIALDEIKAILIDIPKKVDLEKLFDLVKDIKDESDIKDRVLIKLFENIMNKIEEMVLYLPTFNQVSELRRAVELNISNGRDNDEIDKIIQEIEKLPSKQDIKEIGNSLMDIILQNPNIEELKKQLEEVLLNIGSHGESLMNIQERFNNILRKVNATSNTLNTVASNMDVRLKAGLIDKIYNEMLDEYVETYNRTSQTEKLLTKQNLPKEMYKKIKEDAEKVALQLSQKDQASKLYDNFNEDEQIQIPYAEAKYQEQPLGKEAKRPEEEGRGMIANRVKNKVQPKYISRQKMIGKGISLNETPKYIEFGKYCISIPHLNNDILRVKYKKTMVDVPNFKNKISTDFVDFLENFIDTQKINDRQLEKLSKEEQKIFKKLINKSGLDVKYKVKYYKDEIDKQEEDRFNLVKGQYIAGNDNPKVKDELRKFIIKFMMEGKITKKEGQEILFQLSM